MGIPQTWHRRQAMMLASQLPENSTDARLIIPSRYGASGYVFDRPCRHRQALKRRAVRLFSSVNRLKGSHRQPPRKTGRANAETLVRPLPPTRNPFAKETEQWLNPTIAQKRRTAPRARYHFVRRL
jgi:hypothetical protein